MVTVWWLYGIRYRRGRFDNVAEHSIMMSFVMMMMANQYSTLILLLWLNDKPPSNFNIILFVAGCGDRHYLHLLLLFKCGWGRRLVASAILCAISGVGGGSVVCLSICLFDRPLVPMI